MLQLRPNCECCDTDLPNASVDARICSFECTFCSTCAKQKLHGVCPNCGVELQVRPRSGLAVKYGISIVNSPGTVDSDYRGPLMVCLINLGDEPFTIHRGDRIAQAVIAQAPQLTLMEVDDLDATMRGESGFGSTGVK